MLPTKKFKSLKDRFNKPSLEDKISVPKIEPKGRAKKAKIIKQKEQK